LQLRNFIKTVLIVIILGVGCALLAYIAPSSGQNSQAARWYSIVPAVLAILLAFLTHRVLLSLGLAIIVGSLLTRVPQAPFSTGAWLEGFKALCICVADTITSRTNLQILAFIPPIFVMIEVVIVSGGFNGIIVWVLRYVKGKKTAQMATALMGILCFIDDYANAIIVGSMMQPITDRFCISREKLAFLVDATSAPVSGLAVISTWIAYEVGLFADVARQLGIEKSGYSMFFDALGFRFYCLLMLAFVFLQSLIGRDFGPMKAAERLVTDRSTKKQEGSTLEDVVEPILPVVPEQPGRAINALVPLGGLILFHLTGLWMDGGGPAKLAAKGSLLSWIYWREVISDAQHSHLILIFAALFGMILAIFCGRVYGSLRFSTLYNCFARGIKRAILPTAILILAWSLKNCCDSLKTGEFLTAILVERVSPCWFAAIVFLVASVTSFSTGTSWGTMAILIPTAIPVAFALDGQTYGLTTMISLGAVLDGAIFGDHCSPISDTTIISSTASSCDLIQHVRTQLPYSLLVAAMALFCGYFPAALGLSSGLSLVLAILITGCIFIGLGCFRRTEAT